MIIGFGLWTSPAQAQKQEAKPRTADHSQAQQSGKWEMKHGWSGLLGVYPSLFFNVLSLGLGNASCGEHSPSCLCLRRPCDTSYGEHLLSCLFLGNNCVSLWAAGTLPSCFCLSGQAELIWGDEHLLCVKNLLFCMLLLLILLLLLCIPFLHCCLLSVKFYLNL